MMHYSTSDKNFRKKASIRLQSGGFCPGGSCPRTFTVNLLPEFHSVFYVTLHGTLASQYLHTFGTIF